MEAVMREGCHGIIPDTYIACGEDGNYCSEGCWNISSGYGSEATPTSE